MFLSWGAGEKDALRREQYLRMFHDVIPSVVSELDPDTAYWPSSPSSHPEDLFADTNRQDIGDGHYWAVWFERKPFTAYRDQFHRFMSEFGFQSLPAIETVRSFASEEDLNLMSYVMECHQKNGAGNGLLTHYLAQTFRFPRDFEMMCYLSQVLQGEAIRYGVEHWRRSRERCMGTLFWQLNDCWPVCSWSSIDYFGRWKALQYFARRFYSPVMLSVAEDGTKAEIHVTNDTLEPVDVELTWSLEELDGALIRGGSIHSQIPAERNSLVVSLDFSEELAGDAIRRRVLVHELLIDGRRAGLGVTPFVPSKHLELPDVDIFVEAKTDAEGAYFEVSSDKTARFVCLSIPGRDVIFSDNFFDLPAGRKVAVRVESDVEPSVLAQVRAYSLRDSY
jgi:beta-mannosidase